MHPYLQLFLWVTGIVSLLGVIVLISELLETKRTLKNAREFLDRFQHYVQSPPAPGGDASYAWLAMNADKIQAQMGTYGLIDYMPPGSLYMVQNYNVIIQAVVSLRTQTGIAIDHETVIICMFRYIGYLEELKGNLFRQSINPLEWIRVGLTRILSFPFRLILKMGIIAYGVYESIEKFIRAISALAAIVGLAFAVFQFILSLVQHHQMH